MALFAALSRTWMTERPDDEARLIERLARGDRDAIDRLYARFGRPLFTYVADMVGDRGLAEEVVQDTFLAAWRGAAGFEGRSSVASWLFGIARRQARDRQRRSRPPLEPIETLESVPADEPGPEAAALAAAGEDQLIAALGRLPAHHREPLVLAFAYELSGPDIAAILGIPEGTVKSRLHAARRALRSALTPAERAR